MSLSKILSTIFHSRKIQDRFTYTFSLIVILAGVIFYFISSYVRKEMFFSHELHMSKRQIKSFTFRIKKDSEKNLAIATLFSRNYIVEKAYKIAYAGNISSAKDVKLAQARKYLRKNMLPLIEVFKEKTGSSLKLHYHLPPARSLVRLWRKKQVKVNGKLQDISDDISAFRNSIKEISSGKKEVITGIEIGRGGFAIRGISNIQNKKKILGSVEVLSSFQRLVKRYQKEFGHSVSIFMNGEYIDIARKLKNNKNHPVIKISKKEKFYTIYSSGNIENNKFLDVDKLLLGKKYILNDYKDNKKITYFPILSYDKKQIGVGVFYQNINTQLAELRSFKMGVILLIIVVVIATIIISVILGRAISRKFKTVLELISAMARGDLSQSKGLKTINCSKVLDCGKEDCINYDLEITDCFISAGSFAPIYGNEITCPSIISGKVKDCRSCKVMRELAPGELDELISIAHYTLRRLSSLMKSVKDMVVKVSSSVSGLASSSDALLGNVQGQSAAMEEVAATMQQMNISVENISNSAKSQFEKVEVITDEFSKINTQTSSSTKEVESAVTEVEITITKANNGEDILKDTVGSMGKMQKSTNSISETINVISGISAQVDLLSLNASIEAARAGEHGRGFAVVANEISKLSDNTAKSASEIAELISIGNDEAKSGMRMVQKMQDAFSSILTSISEIGNTISSVGDSSKDIEVAFSKILIDVNEVNRLANHIFEVSGEQLNASREVVGTIEDISAGTQGITKEAELVDDMAKDLALAAEKLDEKIQYFKI